MRSVHTICREAFSRRDESARRVAFAVEVARMMQARTSKAQAAVMDFFGVSLRIDFNESVLSHDHSISPPLFADFDAAKSFSNAVCVVGGFHV